MKWRKIETNTTPSILRGISVSALGLHSALHTIASDDGFITAPLTEMMRDGCDDCEAFARVLSRSGMIGRAGKRERQCIAGWVAELVRLDAIKLVIESTREGAQLLSLSTGDALCWASPDAPAKGRQRYASGTPAVRQRDTSGTPAGQDTHATPRNHSCASLQKRGEEIRKEEAGNALVRTDAHAPATTADSLTYLSAFASGAGRRWVEDGSRDERAAVDARLRSIVTSARDAESFGAFTADYLSRSRGKYPAVPALSARKLAYLDRDTGEWNHRELAAAQAEWIDKGETFVARRRAVAVATEDARANAERWSTERSAVETLARAHWHETRAALADGRIVAQIAAPATESAHVAMLLREYAPAPLTSTDAASSHSLSEYRKRESDKATARAGILAAGQIPLRGVRPGYQSADVLAKAQAMRERLAAHRDAAPVSDDDRAARAAEERERLRTQREQREWNQQLTALRADRASIASESDFASDAASEDEREAEVDREDEREVETENQVNATSHTSRSLAAFVAQAAADRARHGQSTRPTWTPPDALDALEEKRPLPSAKPLTLSPPTKTRSDAQRRDAAPTRPAGGRELP